MRNGIVLLLMTLLLHASLRADPIRYDQIPGDAMSYWHVDVDRLLTCRMLSEFGAPPDAAAKVQQKIGGKVSSITVYFLEDKSIHTVFLAYVDANVLARAKAYANEANDKVIVKYGDQEVYYSSEGLFVPLQSAFTAGETSAAPSAEVNAKSHGLFGFHGTFSFGTGTAPAAADYEILRTGPSYKAFVGQDMMVATTNLQTMAQALDVLGGKQPSLARQDLRGLKGEIPAGAIFMGAGLTAQLAGDNTDQRDKSANATTQPARAANGQRGDFGFDMFGSFKGKAQIARFNIGEDGQTDYINVSIMMTDPEFAEQLKNLMLGIKALVTLSQATQAPVIAPLDIRAQGKEVVLHWSWPTVKLSELVRLAQSNADDKPSIHAPTSDR